MLKDTSIQDNIHLSPAWPHISSEVWIWLLPGTKCIVLGFCMAAARHRSSKKSNWSAFHIICVLSIPLLAGTIHTPPVSHTWFAKQKAAVPKKKLLALRCAVGTPKSSGWALHWQQSWDTQTLEWQWQHTWPIQGLCTSPLVTTVLAWADPKNRESEVSGTPGFRYSTLGFPRTWCEIEGAGILQNSEDYYIH